MAREGSDYGGSGAVSILGFEFCLRKISMPSRGADIFSGLTFARCSAKDLGTCP
jgi:hypothetical protein